MKKKENNYYHLDLYFPRGDKKTFPVYAFLSRLSAKRKLTSFLADFLAEYMKLCNVKHPERLTDEELAKLPSLEALVKERCYQTILSSLTGNVTLAPVASSIQPALPVAEERAEDAEISAKEKDASHPATECPIEEPADDEDDEIEEIQEDDDSFDDASGQALVADWESALGGFNISS